LLYTNIIQGVNNFMNNSSCARVIFFQLQ